MKLGTNKRGDFFTLLTNSNLLAKFNSKSPFNDYSQNQGYHSHTEQSSTNITPSRQKPPSSKVFGFGIQVSQIPTQVRDKTPVPKPIVYGYRSSSKNNSRVTPSPYKAQRNTYHSDQVTPEPRSKKPFKLPDITTTSGNRRKVYSQTDISKSNKKRNIFRNDKFSVQKQSLQNQSDDSFVSITGPQETFRNEIKPEEIPKRSIEAYGMPSEGKSYTIVQKRLNNNRDTLFDFWESRAPKKETPLGVYLQKALNEVSPSHYENRGVGGLPMKSPQNAYEIGTKSPGKDREKVRERGRRSKRDSANLSSSFEEQEILDKKTKDLSIVSIDNKYERREIITEPNGKLEEMYGQKDFSVPPNRYAGRRASRVLRETSLEVPTNNAKGIPRLSKDIGGRESNIEKDYERREATEGNLSAIEVKKAANSNRGGKKNMAGRLNVKNKVKSDMDFEPHSPHEDEDDLSLYDYLKLKKENQDENNEYDFLQSKK